MCEFCTQHGEGEKWYLTMENYSKDLLNQNQRRKYAADFLNGFDKRVPKSIKQLDKIRKTPLMKLAKPVLTHMQKEDHYGQVVPMEDVEKIFGMVQGAVRLPCVCRRVTTGNMNARYCYGLTMDKELMDSLDDSFSLETLSKEEALGVHSQIGQRRTRPFCVDIQNPVHRRAVQL
ncbi:hypothetical protein [Candidatus Villigracilis affinis]|uniref:hypothetical protein n=1 Tax=Candidatus Villigracilis affinis TaxID=3140682 RepID=UPI002A1EB056|nr:hypothetical protein [Anaerolineales bacterium]